MQFVATLIIASWIISAALFASPQIPMEVFEEPSLSELCVKSLHELPGEYNRAKIEKACSKVTHFPSCRSVHDEKIFHFDSISSYKRAKKFSSLASFTATSLRVAVWQDVGWNAWLT